MNNREMKRFDMFTRVRDFGVTQATAFPAASLGERLLAELNTVIASLTTEAVNQSSGQHAAQESTSNKAVTRDALHREMEMISRTARTMALDKPGLEDKFRLPRSNADQAWITAAREFRADADPLRAEFLEHELPGDFLTTLDTLIEEFETHVMTSHQSTAAHVAAGANIEADIEHGMTTVQKLDTVVRNKFHNDPGILAAWQSARHVERAPRRAPKNPADTPPPTNP